MNKTYNKILLGIGLYGVFGLIIASFYDLDINKLLYNPDTAYPVFFKFTAEIPMVTMATIASLIYVRNTYKAGNKFLTIFFTLAFFLFPLVSSGTILTYFGIDNLLYRILICVFYFGLSIFVASKIDSKDNKKLLSYCIFVVVTIILSLIAFNIMKILWGRMRFFPMHEANDFSRFTPWWKWAGNSGDDIYKSFPSGHTAAGAASLLLIFIPTLFRDIKIIRKLTPIFYFFPILWTIGAQFGRIIQGAHYLSDTSASIILTVVLILTTKKLFLDKYLNPKSNLV